MVALQLSCVVWGEVFQEWHCENLEVSWQVHPPVWHCLFHPCIAERAPGSRNLGPWHCCSAHPIWWVHHPGWCLYPNFSLPPLGNLVRKKWCRGEMYDPSTQHGGTLLSPSDNFGMWWCPWCPHLLKTWQVDLHMVSGFPVGLSAMVSMPRTSQSLRTLMTPMKKLMLNFSHFQILNLMREGDWGVATINLIAPGLDLSLTVVPNLASGVLVSG